MPEEAQLFRESRRIPFPLLSDPGQRFYRSYGLGRIKPLQEMRAGTVNDLFKELGRGNFGGVPVGEVSQLGGTFLVDTAGIARYVHRDRATNDIPALPELFKAIKALQD